jgi:hypothetical protein
MWIKVEVSLYTQKTVFPKAKINGLSKSCYETETIIIFFVPNKQQFASMLKD